MPPYPPELSLSVGRAPTYGNLISVWDLTGQPMVQVQIYGERRLARQRCERLRTRHTYAMVRLVRRMSMAKSIAMKLTSGMQVSDRALGA